MRKRSFIKVGAVKIPWHRMADGRTCIDPRRLGLSRKTFADHSSALIEAERIARERHNGGADMAEFTAADRAIYAELRRKLNGSLHSVLEIVDAGMVAMARPVHRTSAIAKELLTSKQAHDLNRRYFRTLSSDISAFAEAFPDDIEKILPRDIEQLLQSLNSAPRRRNAFLQNVRHLFTFAIKRNKLPADKTSAAHQVELIDLPSSRVEFFAVWEMQIFLEHVRQEFLPWLALNAFSGARVEEIILSRDAARSKDPLRWEDFDWSERQIAIRAETSKTGRARRIPIVDNLYQWISPWMKSVGPVCRKHPGDYESRRIIQEANKALEKSNDRRRVNWRKNALRHSYGSYRMAMIKNEHQLAYEMGNSVEMIREHYHNPRPTSEAAAYFQIFPKPAENVIQLEIFG